MVRLRPSTISKLRFMSLVVAKLDELNPLLSSLIFIELKNNALFDDESLKCYLPLLG